MRRKIVNTVLLSLVGFVICYLMAAFFNMAFDPKGLGEGGRYFVLMTWTILTILAGAAVWVK